VGNGTTGTINVAQGTHEISAPLALSGAVSKTGTGNAANFRRSVACRRIEPECFGG